MKLKTIDDIIDLLVDTIEHTDILADSTSCDYGALWGLKEHAIRVKEYVECGYEIPSDLLGD